MVWPRIPIFSCNTYPHCCQEFWFARSPNKPTKQDHSMRSPSPGFTMGIGLTGAPAVTECLGAPGLPGRVAVARGVLLPEMRVRPDLSAGAAAQMECAVCRRHTSVTPGTVLRNIRTPLMLWFWMADLMSTHTRDRRPPSSSVNWASAQKLGRCRARSRRSSAAATLSAAAGGTGSARRSPGWSPKSAAQKPTGSGLQVLDDASGPAL